jgi:phage tail protein X
VHALRLRQYRATLAALRDELVREYGAAAAVDRAPLFATASLADVGPPHPRGLPPL